jgi:glutathione S-transferase
MLTLYDHLPSRNAWKVRLLLSHLERPYTKKIVSIFEGHGQHAEFLAINPTGAVPALQFDDGTAIAESNAIFVYLASGMRYFPSKKQQQTQVLQWLFSNQTMCNLVWPRCVIGCLLERAKIDPRRCWQVSTMHL